MQIHFFQVVCYKIYPHYLTICGTFHTIHLFSFPTYKTKLTFLLLWIFESAIKMWETGEAKESGELGVPAWWRHEEWQKWWWRESWVGRVTKPSTTLPKLSTKGQQEVSTCQSIQSSIHDLCSEISVQHYGIFTCCDSDSLYGYTAMYHIDIGNVLWYLVKKLCKVYFMDALHILRLYM